MKIRLRTGSIIDYLNNRLTLVNNYFMFKNDPEAFNTIFKED